MIHFLFDNIFFLIAAKMSDRIRIPVINWNPGSGRNIYGGGAQNKLRHIPKADNFSDSNAYIKYCKTILCKIIFLDSI